MDTAITITVVLDNQAYDERLKADWGFAAVIQDQDETLLFDTGPDGSALLFNLYRLGIDPTQITKLVFSHDHQDHTGGMAMLMGVTWPTVYLLPSFPEVFKRILAGHVVEVSVGQELGSRLFSTGEMGSGPAEQAVVARTNRGLVVITGCAHPGIVQIIQQAQKLFDEDRVHLVLGGFHLLHKQDDELDQMISEFRRLGVEKVAPCHCTGGQALEKFAAVYGDDFIEVGSGRVLVIEG